VRRLRTRARLARLARLARVALVATTAAAILGACGSSASTTRSEPAPATTTTTSTASSRPAPASGPAQAVAATNELALDLLRTTARASANTVFSPYSVQAALAMVYAGAAADTATQIGHVLGATSATALARANAALSSRLAEAVAAPQNAQPGQAPQLNVANGLWLQSALRLRPAFTQTLAGGFGPALKHVDFHRAPEAARQAINAWVAAHTEGLIRNLMTPGSITVRTALVLANAIYLKARWSNPFVAASSAPGTFLTASGARVSAPFMAQQQTPLSYGAGRGFRAIELPYRYSTLSMLVVMPSAGTLSGFERSLTTASVSRIAASLRPSLVDLRMPRFHLVTHIELNAILSALGMPIAFSPQADFSGITTQTPLAISAVEHGADLKVDEAGTVAAAATVISIAPTAAAPGRVVRLTLDHPFVMFIRDDRTGAILFAGRVSDPTQS
jgi:serpin B